MSGQAGRQAGWSACLSIVDIIVVVDLDSRLLIYYQFNQIFVQYLISVIPNLILNLKILSINLSMPKMKMGQFAANPNPDGHYFIK